MNRYQSFIALLMLCACATTQAKKHGYSNVIDYNQNTFISFLKNKRRITIPPPEIVCPIGLPCLSLPVLEKSDWTRAQ